MCGLDFQDFNYITSSGTTLGEMLSTENFLESYGYDSKSPDDIFADDVVYDTNDFVAIIKQEPGFEYHDYQMNTSPESELSSYEDQLQLVNASNDLMSVDVEYLMKMQQAPIVKRENENVVIKVEASDSNLFTDESVPVFSHEGKYLLLKLKNLKLLKHTEMYIVAYLAFSMHTLYFVNLKFLRRFCFI